MKYRTQRLLLLLAAVLFVGGWLVYCLRLPRHAPRVTEENYRLLKRGMTLAGVEAVLNAPPGDYAGGRRAYITCACSGSVCDVFYDWKYNPAKMPTAKEIDTVAKRERIAIWWGRDLMIAAQLDESGRVIHLGYGRPWREPGQWDRVREWIGW